MIRFGVGLYPHISFLSLPFGYANLSSNVPVFGVGGSELILVVNTPSLTSPFSPLYSLLTFVFDIINLTCGLERPLSGLLQWSAERRDNGNREGVSRKVGGSGMCGPRSQKGGALRVMGLLIPKN